MDMNRLTRPFLDSEIKVREGRKNMQFQYIPSEYVVDRLNEIGPANWNFIIKDSKQIGNEVVVLGSLQIGNTVKEAFGSAVIDENKTAGDSYKTAQMLSLVKSASLYNVPCIFKAKLKQGKNNQYYNQQSNNTPQDFNCDHCNLGITQAEINFTSKYPQIYNGQKLCRNCQKKYRNRNIQRVQ
ncbi:hypothetical protein GLW08_19180 [Pontibacillus yanchengensis]|uniref:Uncharacterized protein n=1 Tax=Pontibacillus yanchengensis TaxID=462910 RepID=A0ACC7VM74_9BACI|nr:Rad52/Rad22 family DNA repair protein [Pontibacillus yanchengensis]MYL55441.1 hypothetical protein [Pontibacillus yanchengensis]